MTKRVAFAALIACGWHFLCLALLFLLEWMIFLIPIIPGWMLAVTIVGYRFDYTRSDNVAFHIIWLGTSVVLFTPIVATLMLLRTGTNP